MCHFLLLKKSQLVPLLRNVCCLENHNLQDRQTFVEFQTNHCHVEDAASSHAPKPAFSEELSIHGAALAELGQAKAAPPSSTSHWSVFSPEHDASQESSLIQSKNKHRSFTLSSSLGSS